MLNILRIQFFTFSFSAYTYDVRPQYVLLIDGRTYVLVILIFSCIDTILKVCNLDVSEIESKIFQFWFWINYGVKIHLDTYILLFIIFFFCFFFKSKKRLIWIFGQNLESIRKCSCRVTVHRNLAIFKNIYNFEAIDVCLSDWEKVLKFWA